MTLRPGTPRSRRTPKSTLPRGQVSSLGLNCAESRGASSEQRSLSRTMGEIRADHRRLTGDNYDKAVPVFSINNPFLPYPLPLSNFRLDPLPVVHLKSEVTVARPDPCRPPASAHSLAGHSPPARGFPPPRQPLAPQITKQTHFSPQPQQTKAAYADSTRTQFPPRSPGRHRDSAPLAPTLCATKHQTNPFSSPTRTNRTHLRFPIGPDLSPQPGESSAPCDHRIS
jgi:hypothetical protein